MSKTRSQRNVHATHAAPPRISGLLVGNFKAIGTERDINVRPITVFIGANSSGKSTCIHALTALSQSLKLPNNTRALTLDDEQAHVHLGRFIEIVHSRSYNDSVKLGITIEDAKYYVPMDTDGGAFQQVTGRIRASFTFRCRRRTQEVIVDLAEYQTEHARFSVKMTPGGFQLRQFKPESKSATTTAPLVRRNAFVFDRAPQSRFAGAAASAQIQFRSMQDSLTSALQAVLYLGPFRLPPIRRYPTRGSGPAETGSQGEATMTMLANEAVQSQKKNHINQISHWLTALGLGGGIKVDRIGKSDLFEPSVALSDGKRFPLADLGYGLSQVLPVLTQCSFATRGKTLAFEQPELHLHAGAARRLTQVFAETMNRGVNIVIETHAKELVSGFQGMIRKGEIKKTDIAIYKTERISGESQLTAVDIEDDGDIYSNWKDAVDN